ncbi:MAG: type IVB secretion system protein IcmH/DotU [Alphaproteobacteria bacterium]
MGRVTAPARGASGVTNPLREIFTDLIAYIIFFRASCEEQPRPLNEIREKVIALLNAQDERVKTSGVAVETFREARFAVLSWVDEMILNSNWPQRNQWQHLMLTYYGTLNAGEEFFHHLEQLPSPLNDVREIYYLCLSLGYQGRYAVGDDPRELKDMQAALYKQLCASNGDIRQNYNRLFPEAYQKAIPSTAAPARVKLVWYIAVFSIPVILFAGYFWLLHREANRILAKLVAPQPAPPPVDWGSRLVDELRARGFYAVDEPKAVRIILQSLLFATGSKELKPEAVEKIDGIVAIVKQYAPQQEIVIEGHASRERDSNEAQNQKLSEERARTVADAFVRAGYRNEKISAVGYGTTRPVALNDTEEGRAKNRRVEIVVRK